VREDENWAFRGLRNGYRHGSYWSHDTVRIIQETTVAMGETGNGNAILVVQPARKLFNMKTKKCVAR
jgi:hypothetical protein